jgi:hypothetical protein
MQKFYLLFYVYLIFFLSFLIFLTFSLFDLAFSISSQMAYARGGGGGDAF